MYFRQLFHPASSTCTYVLGDPGSRRALLIDPVREEVERYLELLDRADLELELVLDTHLHADHVTAAGELRERTGARTGVAAAARSRCATLALVDGDEIALGAASLRVLATPGHTPESLSYLAGDRVFTGDALFIGGCGRTDFQGGDAGELYDSVTGRLFTLPGDTLVYPGHSYAGRTVSTIGEERRLNPRFSGRGRDAFIELMRGLDLPKPALLDVAVPANRACGLPGAPVQG